MSQTIPCQVDGLVKIYAYEETKNSAAFFEFESAEKAQDAAKEIRKYCHLLNGHQDNRIPKGTKFKVVLGYSTKGMESIGQPFKCAEELIKRALSDMDTEIKMKDVPIVQIERKQLKHPHKKNKSSSTHFQD